MSVCQLVRSNCFAWRDCRRAASVVNNLHRAKKKAEKQVITLSGIFEPLAVRSFPLMRWADFVFNLNKIPNAFGRFGSGLATLQLKRKTKQVVRGRFREIPAHQLEIRFALQVCFSQQVGDSVKHFVKEEKRKKMEHHHSISVLFTCRRIVSTSEFLGCS